MRKVEDMVPDSLRKWLKDNGEFVHDMYEVAKYNAVHFNTGKQEYIYYPDSKQLLVEVNKQVIEYEPVLYPNRAVETKFEGM